MKASRVAATEGSAIAMYHALPGGVVEADLLCAAMPKACDVLVIGSGSARLARELEHRGFDVIATDIAPDGTPGAAPRGERFRAVIVPNDHLNAPNARARDALVERCAENVTTDGVVLMRRCDPGWARTIGAEPSRIGELEVRVRDAGRDDGGFVCAAIEHRLGMGRWQTRFTAALLDDGAIDALLDAHGLQRSAWLDPSRRWFSAVPIDR